MSKCESIWNLNNQNDVQCQQRGDTKHGANGSRGFCWLPNSSSCGDSNKGKGKNSDNQDEGDEMEDMDGSTIRNYIFRMSSRKRCTSKITRYISKDIGMLG